MRKNTRKLQLSRETIRSLSQGLNRVVGGYTVATVCPESQTACGSACPACDSVKCEGTDTGVNCTNSVCSNTCQTGGACTL